MDLDECGSSSEARRVRVASNGTRRQYGVQAEGTGERECPLMHLCPYTP